jgi:cytidylate kinase
MTTIALEGLQRYLDSQFLRLANEKTAVSRKNPFVTISRQAGAGGITVGRMLETYLKEHDKKVDCPWTLFDKDLVKKVAEDHNLPERLAEYMKEDKVSEIKEILDEIFQLHPPDWVLAHKTSETILHLAEMGHVIVVGRGSNIVTKKLPDGFHVRLVGPYEKRLLHIQSYYGFSLKASEEFIKKEDEGRKKYLKTYFGQNIDDPLLYDLVINTDSISYGEAARIIGHAALAT